MFVCSNLTIRHGGVTLLSTDDEMDGEPTIRRSQSSEVFALIDAVDASIFGRGAASFVISFTRQVDHASVADAQSYLQSHPTTIDSDEALVEVFVSGGDLISYEEGIVDDVSGTVVEGSKTLWSYRLIVSKPDVTVDGGNAPTFSPADLGASVVAWYRADLGVTKDGSDLVSAWADQSGNGFDLAQGTGALQPTWLDSEVDGQDAIAFDGSDILATGDVGENISQPLTVFMAMKFDVLGADVYVFDGVDATNRLLIRKDSGNLPSMFAGSFIAGASAVGSANYLLFRAVFNTTLSQLYVNEVAQVFGNAGTKHLRGLSLGAAYNSAVDLNGKIAEFLLFDGIPTAQELADVIGYFDERYPSIGLI